MRVRVRVRVRARARARARVSWLTTLRSTSALLASSASWPHLARDKGRVTWLGLRVGLRASWPHLARVKEGLGIKVRVQGRVRARVRTSKSSG